ncbi:MAG: hypothetical protein JO336_18085 [Acidobacteriia bacterium]|nr:hypothetical protein [Terriglobia bacterium]
MISTILPSRLVWTWRINPKRLEDIRKLTALRKGESVSTSGDRQATAGVVAGGAV